MKTVLMGLRDFEIEYVTVEIPGKDYEMKLARLVEALLGLLDSVSQDSKSNQGPLGPELPEAA